MWAMLEAENGETTPRGSKSPMFTVSGPKNDEGMVFLQPETSNNFGY